MERWYVVYTHANGETLAQQNLERQGFRTYVPMYSRKRRHARKTSKVRWPLFPRYLFVSMDVERARWRAIQSTIGVARLVCFGTCPAPMPEGVVEAIVGREGDEGLIDVDSVRALTPGDKVQILSGALMDRIGLLFKLEDSDRVVVLLELLGRSVKIRLPDEFVGAYT